MANEPQPSGVDEEWRFLNEAVRRLEECWHSGKEPELDRLLPRAEGPARRRALVELIKIDQEHRYQSVRLLESYLDEWPELAADAELLVELLEAECMTRMAIGETPTREELSARFPAFAGRIDLNTIAAEVVRESGTATEAGDDDRGADADAPSAPDRYQIRAVLGRGSMGTVYRAYDTQLHREVGLKIPSTDVGQDPRVWNRLYSEARAVASVQHRNVCAVYDVGQSHGRYYLAMALVQGEPLASQLKRGCLDCRQAATLAWKLAGALAAVHATGIVHRDVKPQNVMLDAEGEPLLMDFGLARPVQWGAGKIGESVASGTPAYMSPEQVRGEPITAASDIYALGVVLYQMLTGRLPFCGPMPQLASRILGDKVTSPRALCPQVDNVLESICLKAIERRPEDRFRSARELENALLAYLRSTEQIDHHSRIQPQSVNLVLTPLSIIQRLKIVAWWTLFITGAAAAIALIPYFVFRAMPANGALVLEIHPADAINATIWIDGAERTYKPPRDAIMLPAGRHELRVKLPGFQEESEAVFVEKGRKAEVTISLRAVREK